MKIALIILAALGITGFAIKSINAGSGTCSKPVSATKSSTKTIGKTKGVAVVELFTSEGCSSCPSADALLAKLDAEKQKDVYVLSYHVDYWDRLGWKDAFSKPEWTQRQYNYVNHFKLESAYTPEAVVNGSEEFIGSGKLQLYTAVDNSLQQTAQPLELKATAQEGKVNVSYTAPDVKNSVVNFALVQSAASTQVGRGENGGKQLHHVNVVRDLMTIPTSQTASTVSFSVPQNFSATDYKVIAFLQDKSSFKISGAAQSSIQ